MTGVPLAEVAELNEPQAGEQAAEFWVRVQFRPRFAPSLETVAENCWPAPSGIRALEGESGETITAGTVTLIEPDWVGSATDVAATVTLKSLTGGEEGAV